MSGNNSIISVLNQHQGLEISLGSCKMHTSNWGEEQVKRSFKNWILHCTLNLWRFPQINYFTYIIHVGIVGPFFYIWMCTQGCNFISQDITCWWDPTIQNNYPPSQIGNRGTNLSSLKSLSDWNQSDSIKNARNHSNENLNRQPNNQSSTHRGSLMYTNTTEKQIMFLWPTIHTPLELKQTHCHTKFAHLISNIQCIFCALVSLTEPLL
jgi:hypothetical protein